MGYSIFPLPSSAAYSTTATIRHQFDTTTNSPGIPSGTNLVYAAVYGGGGGGGGVGGSWQNTAGGTG